MTVLFNEHRLIGPPGTGKTTKVSSEVKAANRQGNRIMVTSHTQAAANELVGRDLPLGERAIGTLHSICYYALDKPRMTEKYLNDFNTTHPAYRVMLETETGSKRHLGLHGARVDEFGDQCSNAYHYLRARQVPRGLWPPKISDFARYWESWKQANDLTDFTDLIEDTMRDFAQAPGKPDVIFADEAQDFTPLQFALLRQWGQRAQKLYVSGDPDQTLYSHIGAMPEAFLASPIPEEQIECLPQSYRLPRSVKERADRMIAHIQNRQPSMYTPRPVEGKVQRLGTILPEKLSSVIDEYLKQDKSVMLLAACDYHLSRMLKMLRMDGIPFHNPFQERKFRWNPFTTYANVAVSPLDRAFLASRLFTPQDHILRGGWAGNELYLALEPLDLSRIVKHGAENAFQRLQATNELVTLEQLGKILQAAAIERIVDDQQLHWWERHLNAKWEKRLGYPIAVVRSGRTPKMVSLPRLIVGTIHSVKGGEADVVILLADMSRAGYEAWTRSGEGRDAVIRTFYVGMTRARETLLLVDSHHREHMVWPG